MENTGKRSVHKILFLTAESSPFVKIGGLGDVSGSLPGIIMQQYGQQFDVRVVMPYHHNMQLQPQDVQPIDSFTLESTYFSETITILQHQKTSIPFYFLQSNTLSATGPYSEDGLVDLRKYSLFCQAMQLTCEHLNWQPNLLHANDWHTALAIYLLTSPEMSQTRKILKTILSIHNLPYMGAGDRDVLRHYGIQPSDDPDLPDWARQIPLPMGISRADRVLTVSNGYAQEIMTPDFGCGLDPYFQKYPNKVGGILNGIDEDIWNPQTDPLIVANFSLDQLDKRLENKRKLLSDYFPDPVDNQPLLIWVGRLQGQKGADVLLESLQAISDLPWQCIILGTGDANLESIAAQFSTKHPQKLAFVAKFDNALSHQLYAGGDMIIMPSRYEPCGLSQMFAMRYGCLAVATATGGLKDTIDDIHQSAEPTGFLFPEATTYACSTALQEAIDIYVQNPNQWKTMQQRAMKKDFSWNRSAEQYKNEYLSLLEKSS